MIFELAQDFAAVLAAMPSGYPRHRIVALLDEAIRRDTQFIDRHPTTLFQCLWNSCWWYDCPEAAHHYVEGRTPGQDCGVNLHGWLERLRAEKSQHTPGFFWLRSLRPPIVHLGAGLKAVLAGLEGGVTCIAYSADGQHLIGGGDGLHVWDAAWQLQTVFRREYQAALTGIACSPDGRQVASVGVGDDLYVLDIQTRQVR